jgi:adenine-specific DNA-methyltransferase
LPSRGRCWSTIESNFKKLEEAGKIYWGKDGDAMPSRKKYLDEDDGMVPMTYWSAEEVGDNSSGKREIISMFSEGEIFSTPKPTGLIERIVQIASTKDSTVLDFFAGSGTTAQAVLKLNQEDGGTRDCIVVTNNENDIARNICYQRIKKVIEGYETTSKNEKVEGLGGSLKYYQSGEVNLPHPDQADDVDDTYASYNEELNDLIALKNNLSDQNKLESEDEYVIYRKDADLIAILFDDLAEDDLIEKIEELNNQAKETSNIIVYKYCLKSAPEKIGNYSTVDMPNNLINQYNSSLEVVKSIYSDPLHNESLELDSIDINLFTAEYIAKDEVEDEKEIEDENELS